MSHEIEQMAYVGQVPWHGLGNILTAGQTIETWRTEAGLDWQVHESPVFFMADNGTRLREAQTRKVLYRSDTNEPLNIVSLQYKPVQPAEVLEFYRDLISDFGFELETAGSLKGGQKIWALAKTGEDFYVGAGDGVKGYLLLATSYDGTLATTAQFTSVRVVCNNTLQLSLSSEFDAIKIGHREEFNPTEVKAQLGLGKSAFAAFAEAADLMHKLHVDSDAAGAFYKRVLRVDQNLETADARLAQQLAERFNAGSYIAPEFTAWGLVNNVTEYLDHVRRQSAEGNRLHSAWFGPGAAIKARAWQAAVDLATA